jgi:hypothetical protein
MMKRRCVRSLGAFDPLARGGVWKVFTTLPPGCIPLIAAAARSR